MSEPEMIAQLFLVRPHRVYGPYMTQTGFVGYDVDLLDQVARVYIQSTQNSSKSPLLIVHIEGFMSESAANAWLNSIMVADKSIIEQRDSKTWTATQYFEGVDLGTLLLLYPESNPLFPKVLRKNR